MSIQARYSGTCGECGGRWSEGDLILRATALHGSGGWQHSVCPDDPADPSLRPGEQVTWSITERRAICHARLRRKYAKCLRSKDFTPAEMDEFGDTLRGYIEEEADKKKTILAMLAWPTDPSFDLRALERSGIDNPYAIGLILPDHMDIDEYVRNVVA